MGAETTHASLLGRLRDADDRSAWDEFDAKYRGLVLGYARRRGLQEADAEDVRQLVMMSLARTLPHFIYRPEIGRFRDYLGRVVRNAISKSLSCPRPDRARLFDDAWESIADPSTSDADAAWDEEWVDHHFRRAMDQARVAFEPRSLEVFDRLLEGLSPGDAAAALGMDVQAVYKVKQRVRDFLRERIAEQVADEELPDPA